MVIVQVSFFIVQYKNTLSQKIQKEFEVMIK